MLDQQQLSPGEKVRLLGDRLVLLIDKISTINNGRLLLGSVSITVDDAPARQLTFYGDRSRNPEIGRLFHVDTVPYLLLWHDLTPRAATLSVIRFESRGLAGRTAPLFDHRELRDGDLAIAPEGSGIAVVTNVGTNANRPFARLHLLMPGMQREIAIPVLNNQPTRDSTFIYQGARCEVLIHETDLSRHSVTLSLRCHP